MIRLSLLDRNIMASRNNRRLHHHQPSLHPTSNNSKLLCYAFKSVAQMNNQASSQSPPNRNRNRSRPWRLGLLTIAAITLVPVGVKPMPSSMRTRPGVSQTIDELEMMSRMGTAIACGTLIGIERRTASANAGIRTMSLVSLGSAIFVLTSAYGLGGDASRMGAAVSTGIGFLGSGAITDSAGRRQLVTAASIWISAAVGVAAACGLYRLAVSGAILTVCILRWRLACAVIRKWFRREEKEEKHIFNGDTDVDSQC